MTPHVLLVAATTGYQVRSFTDAVARLGVDLLFATDRCHVLDNPWQDRAIPIRFHDEDAAVRAITAATADDPVDGVLAVGDRPAVIAAGVAHALRLRWHSPDAARIAANKLLTRVRLREADLPSPWFTSLPIDASTESVSDAITFPCVVKPLSMAASRGVIRANTTDELIAAVHRVRGVLRLPGVQAMRDPTTLTLLVEEYVAGWEVAVEGVMSDRALQILAIFDKPDPLEGPFFEETIYVTPSRLPDSDRRRIAQAVTRATSALGLSDGPIHAECRVNERGVFVLEVAARPIGGLCAKALRFDGAGDTVVTLEELLLRHAVGETVTAYRRETQAAGVMMIPIPTDGLYKRVAGRDDARAVKHIEEIVITAKLDQRIRPLPEGGSYLGFIFARAPRHEEVVGALRASHERLRFEIEPSIPMM